MVSLHPDEKASNISVDGESEERTMDLVVRVDYQLVNVVGVD